MSTITLEQQNAIAAKLANMHLPSGLGDAENVCSIAAINLALTGKLSATIPECMSAVIGSWIIQVQDAMPDAMRNSAEWKSLLPLAAGTGRAHEQERSEVLLNWMWERVLPVLQPLADKHGFGNEWQHMCTERTVKSAVVAKDAANAAAYAAGKVNNTSATWYATYSAGKYAADAATYAAAVETAADAAVWAAAEVNADAAAYAAAAAAAAAAARYAANATAWAARDAAWEAMDPCGVLELLIDKGEK